MNEKIVKSIWKDHFGVHPKSIERFHTGLAHYVYRIDDEGKKFTLRIAHPDNRSLLASSIYWLDKLENLDIPIPKILVQGLGEEVPYLILEYIEGSDLGAVYHQLESTQKQEIARNIVQIQKKVSQMPQHKGYGYLASYEDSAFLPSWKAVVLQHLERSENRIKEAGIFDEAYVVEVRNLLENYEEYLSSIEPIPFLDDTTTKNVLIHEGRLNGIIDLDWVCFGDPLYTVALTKMALFSLKADTEYIDYWTMELDISSEQEKVLDLYTLIFCLDFMSEKGMTFNKQQPLGVTEDEKNWYIELYESLINVVKEEQ